MNNKPASKSSWIDEYHDGTRYGLEGTILIDEKSQFQRITLIDSKRYGKALLLDGSWMTAEFQEKNYHECLVHPALSSSQTINKVLIIGRMEKQKNFELIINSLKNTEFHLDIFGEGSL